MMRYLHYIIPALLLRLGLPDRGPQRAAAKTRTLCSHDISSHYACCGQMGELIPLPFSASGGEHQLLSHLTKKGSVEHTGPEVPRPRSRHRQGRNTVTLVDGSWENPDVRAEQGVCRGAAVGSA